MKGTLLGDVGILTQREIEELSDIALGGATVTAQATQFWDVQPQTAVATQKSDEQRDLLDFLKNDQSNTGPKAEKQQIWETTGQQGQVSVSQTEQGENRPKQDDQWKQDPRIQALIADRMHPIEMVVRNESTEGKRKQSGRFMLLIIPRMHSTVVGPMKLSWWARTKRGSHLMSYHRLSSF